MTYAPEDFGRESVKRHAMRRGGQRAQTWMSGSQYEAFVKHLRDKPHDVVNTTGQRGYRIILNGVPLIAAWNDKHDCIITFLPEPNLNWRSVDQGETALGAKLKAALSAGRDQ